MQNCPMCKKWNEQPELRITELEHCYAMLNGDQFFPGYTFVFAKNHETELFHLEREVRSAVMEEVTAVAAALHRVFQPDKINYELLGNMVPHMHWHIVPRFSSDPLWPRPIWSEPHEELLLQPQSYTDRIALISASLKNTSP